MIKIIENRRLWDVNHKVEAISDTEIKVTVDDKEEIFDLSSLEDGERYILEDSLVLPYNPITGIQKENGIITVATFYDDPHKRGFEAEFKRESGKIVDAVPLSVVQREEIKRIPLYQLSEIMSFFLSTRETIYTQGKRLARVILIT